MTVSIDDPLQRLHELVRSERGALVAIARAEGLTPEEALECVQDALCTFLTREREGHASPGDWALASIKLTVQRRAELPAPALSRKASRLDRSAE